MFCITDQFNQIIFHFIRIEIQQSDPVNAFNRIQFLQQFTKMLFIIPVKPIPGTVLGNKGDFLHPIFHKFLCLSNNFRFITAVEAATDQRNRTKAATVVTAIADLQIGHPWLA